MANADAVIGNVKSSVSEARSAVRRDLRNDRRERLRAMTDENRDLDRLGLRWARIWLVSVASLWCSSNSWERPTAGGAWESRQSVVRSTASVSASGRTANGDMHIGMGVARDRRQ